MAASIDPKDLLLQNKGLVVAYVLALVPVILHFVVNGGLAGEVAKEKGALQRAQNELKAFHSQLSTPDTPLFTEQDKERLTQRRKLYEEELGSLGGIVADRDAPLERWFAKYEGEANPDFNDYLVEWESNQIPNLVGKYADLLGDQGQALLFVDVPGRNELRMFQKRYWIQCAILEALKQGGAKRLAHPGIDFREAELVKGADFAVIPVRVTFMATFPNVPLVLKELLSTELTIRVAGMKITKDAFEFERENMAIDGSRRVFLDYAYGELLRNESPPSNPAQVITEPAVKVELTLQVYDFGEGKKKE